MTLLELINSIEIYDDQQIVFADQFNGKFEPLSEALALELSDEELSLPTKEIAKKYCPDKSYFLEVFLVKEMVLEFKKLAGSGKVFSLEQVCEQIIFYAENDA